MAAIRTLFLLRHAKSSWNNPHLEDRERPLNRRGLRDAPMMGKYLVGIKGLPELIISSPAVRAYQTAKIIAAELDYDPGDIRINDSIYEAHPADLLEIIRGIPSSVVSALMVGHNPGFTSIANILAGTEIETIPTCGFCSVRFESDNWSSVAAQSGQLLNFEYPKKFRQPEPTEDSESSTPSCAS